MARKSARYFVGKQISPMPTPRNHLSTAVLGGKIYALGGQFGHDCNGADQKYCHVYDAVANKWTRLTDLPSPRSHTEAATFPLNGKIYFIGGQGSSGTAQNTVLTFTPTSNGGLGSWSDATQYKLPNSYYGISSKVVGNSFIISHGALTTITNERKETYTASITRSIPYKFGFATNCFSQTLNSNQKTAVKNFLYTIEGEKQYNLTSSAGWLKISKNAAGLAIQSAVEIEATIDATGLEEGSYSATITANGTGTGQAYTSASFCVNLTVGLATSGYTLAVNINGNDSVAKNPDQTAYASGTSVTLTATAATGYHFAGWSGSASATTNPLTVTMNSNKTITANFAAVSGQQVTSFTLVNADTDQDIKMLSSGDILNLATLPTKNLNIRANTNPSVVGSVKLVLSGPQTRSVTENTAPYSLFGDVSGNYAPWAPATGDYKLTATPHSASNGSGTAGTALTISFTVTNESETGLITNVTSLTGRSYRLGELVEGTAVYTDRTYQVTTVPSFLNKAPFIKTPNDDKANKATEALSFNLTQNATVYIGYDPRATALPAWMSDWQKLTEKVGINDPVITYLELYSKTYPAGKVTLGGNLASPAAGALNQYCVIAQAQQAQLRMIISQGTGTKAGLKEVFSINPDKIKTPSIHFSETNRDKTFISHSLIQNNKVYPNPFIKNTKIYYSLKNKAHVNLSIHNIQGQQVQLLANGLKEAGDYQATFNAGKFASGMYIYIDCRQAMKSKLKSW